MLAPFETSFAGALLDAERPVPSGVTAHNAAVPTRRFAVYRNNVVAGLVKALRSRFPAVEKITGEEFFAAMARVFVAERPPHSPLLATYGDEFADFIAAFEPARELGYLADVARLEAARTRAYHAADAIPVDASRFAALDADAVDGIRVAMHPATEIVRSPHPIVTIRAMNSGEQELVAIEDWRGEDALVARPYLDVEVRALPPGGAAFLLALAAGRPLGEAAAIALAEDSEFDLTRNLAGLIGWGLVRDVVLPETNKAAPP
jgi:hypothetical protein